MADTYEIIEPHEIPVEATTVEDTDVYFQQREITPGTFQTQRISGANLKAIFSGGQDKESVINFKFNPSTAGGDPGSNYFSLNNVDPALATVGYFSKIMEDIDISSIVEDLKPDDDVITKQVGDDTKFLVATTVAPITIFATYVEVPLTINDSGIIFDTDALCSTNYKFASSGGGGHTIEENAIAFIQRSKLDFVTANSETVVSDDVPGDRTKVTMTINSMNDFDATGQQAGDVITRNALNDGFEITAVALFDGLLSNPEANISADTLLGSKIEQGCKLYSVIAKNQTANAITGFELGTTSSGNDIVSATDIGANETVEMTILKGFFDLDNDTDLYASTVSSVWNSGAITLYLTKIKIA